MSGQPLRPRAKAGTRHEAQWYASPIDLPEATSGKVQVRHRTIPVGNRVDIVGMRQAFLRGLRPASGIVKAPLRIHELVHSDHGMWMTDLPEELNQIAELMCTVQPQGKILVGGLGLGILAYTLTLRPGVTDVLVVERDKHVVKLCARPGYQVAISDIVRYLTKPNERFDYYLLDTWQGTSEATWWEQVMPLRRLIRQRWGAKPVVHCWAEDIMQGQILRTLTGKPPHWHYTGLPMPMSTAQANAFLKDVGLPTWEQRYGHIIDTNRQRKP